MPNPLYRFPLAYTQTPYGPFIYMPMDDYVGKSLEKYGWYSPSECRFLSQLVQPGWRVANIGAQMGYVARVMSHVGGIVEAFEPQPGMFDVLNANSRLGEGRVIPTNVAIGKEYKQINVPHFNYSVPANFGAIDQTRWTSGNQIVQLQLDEMYTHAAFDLIQIDAEGMEQDILEGGKELIARTRPVLFLENDKPETGTNLIKYLHSINYTCYWVVTPLFEPNNPAGETENVFPGVAAFNMACFPSEGSNNKHIGDMESFCRNTFPVVKETDTIGAARDWCVIK